MDPSDARATLDALVREHGVSYAALSRMLRRNAAYLQQYVRRGTPRRLAERDRRLLAEFFDVEEARLGGPAGAPARARVRRLDVAASAGPGGTPGDDPSLGEESFDAAMLARLGVRAADLSMLRAQGDSMEPTIEDGDQMMVDRADRRIGARRGIFVIRLDGVLMVKDVARERGEIRITSRNPAAPAIPPRPPSDVEIIGRVVWLSRALK